MAYESNLKVYYCAQSSSPSDSNRIVPAPMLTINPEIYYANDSVIGYTYNITLKGYANALRLEDNSRPVGQPNYGANQTIGHMDDIRNIFNFNGGNLHVKSGSSTVLLAKGGTVKSINFDQSDNFWVNYSQFTIEIEFNEIDMTGCSNNPAIACNSSFFHTPNQSSNEYTSDNLVDMKKFKIKEFSDKWSISIDDQIYDNYQDFYNSNFRVTYTLSATGKNYYNNDQFVPAWEQAKLFVQDRLYTQVNGLINGILVMTGQSNPNYDGCLPGKKLSEIHAVSTDGGIMDAFDTPKNGGNKYQVHNEIITCETSESDGSFSITYNAILKRHNPSFSKSQNSCIHTYTKSISYDASNQVTINIQGTLQGLVQGGFIYEKDVEFTLPKNGTFITRHDGEETKYSNALAFYNSRIGIIGGDLMDSLKQTLNITKSALLISNPTTGYPVAQSFTLDHDYHEGSITYTAVYDTKSTESNDMGYTNISIVRKDPVQMTQEFIIPGRVSGPIIQKLRMFTPLTISINIDGAHPSNKSCGTGWCNADPINTIANIASLRTLTGDTWIKTKDDTTVNSIDGSFSINLEYMCKNNQPLC